MKILEKIDESFFKKIDLENLKEIDEIIENVKKDKDSAIIKYCSQFGDGNFANGKDFLVTKEEIQDALSKIDLELLEAIKTAINNVKEFAKGQLSCIQNLKMQVDKHPNSYLGHKIIPVENALVYVPGGNYPLISSAIMGVVPAVVAGVKNIYVTSPKITPEVILTAHLSGANGIYKIGGVQAIVGFAYGTENLPKVDKIVGPGNKYVTYAKKQVYGECGIDFIAGPSEVLIVADDKSNAKLVAADMLAQCEHDKNARAYLICQSLEFAKKVSDFAEEELKELTDIARFAWDNSICYITKDLQEAIEISNKKAPEHLEIVFEGAKEKMDQFKNYGSLFIGENCAEVFGDYCSGTNHVLPTNQVAKYHGGLSVFDFIKIQTYQEIDKEYSKQLAKTASILANAEGLMAHKRASDLRG
ncbi:MAG: histidinol dehydrogenase [Cyanobacteria bacterium SIG30]|nr:histidinol dehydrogenase [Cyanobacteria bacterium SIG30]